MDQCVVLGTDWFFYAVDCAKITVLKKKNKTIKVIFCPIVHMLVHKLRDHSSCAYLMS